MLLRGPSGAGKSDLALRLIAGGGRFPGLAGEPVLIADDQVQLWVADGRLAVTAPEAIAGRLEIRGIGIVTVPHAREARLALVIDLVPQARVPRLPEPESVVLLGVSVPRLSLEAFSASTPVKVLAALAACG